MSAAVLREIDRGGDGYLRVTLDVARVVTISTTEPPPA